MGGDDLLAGTRLVRGRPSLGGAPHQRACSRRRPRSTAALTRASPVRPALAVAPSSLIGCRGCRPRPRPLPPVGRGQCGTGLRRPPHATRNLGHPKVSGQQGSLHPNHRGVGYAAAVEGELGLAQPDRTAARGQPRRDCQPTSSSSARGWPCGSPSGGRWDGAGGHPGDSWRRLGLQRG